MRDQKHNFALYYHDLQSNLKTDTSLKVDDQELVHRVIKILRLQLGDQLTLFANNQVLTGIIELIDKKSFILTKCRLESVAQFKPAITMALGVLKKDNFENALYNCVEFGANQITPVIFAKSIPQKLNQERINKIIISAAEQSKNFSLPDWHEPVRFTVFLEQIKQNLQTTYLYCDVGGQDLSSIIHKIKSQVCNQLVMIVGPEGDLTSDEKALLVAQPNVLIVRLTPTVLRSYQAVALALGAMRALL